MEENHRNTFTAIDFETAQFASNSICQIGLVRVENGEVVSTIDQLVKPPHNYYTFGNIKVHGITPNKTLRSPTFEDVWGDVKPFIEGETVVAHNAAFDVACLKSTLAYYDLACPRFTQKCTYQIYRKRLSLLCNIYKIPLNHHDALSDAMACAKLYLIYLEQNKTLF